MTDQRFEFAPASNGDFGSPRSASAKPTKSPARDTGWPRRYASRLFYSDAAVIAVTFACYTLFALDEISQPVSWPGPVELPYWALLIFVAFVWLIGLDVIDTRDRHIVGHGITEYQRLVNATLAVFAFLIALAFFLQMDVARSLFALALPLGLAGLLASRWIWRQWLRRYQRKGNYVYRAVVLGEPAKVAHIIRQIQQAPDSGFLIVGAVITEPQKTGELAGVRVVGDLKSATRAVEAVGADMMIVSSADALDPKAMRRIGWEMADRDVDWVVAPALTDVAGPRIHARPVAGLPLVHVDFPKLEGYKRVAKRAFDVIGSSLLILVFSPILLATAIAIRVDGPGPIFYHQTRIGRRGREFGMIKFRSMVANADDQLASLLDVQGTTDQPLFKVTNDPRITKVGRFIRRHSIDELPQLFNVFLGEMSLVGPRPQRAAEVALYDDDAHRRLLVKPGMSGLWQVSGRSKLSWDDAIRLDLYYVENWSFTQDIQILFRTIKAVIAPGETAH
ncbi:sugar transferase [Microbacterium hibisci]|uniref:sugar transferase n=1 Tax=Microbacterium hibisci TaxID=2036000 RepID=UPI0027DA9D80|nr:sugar transferase [Microbacterium hibisci]